MSHAPSHRNAGPAKDPVPTRLVTGNAPDGALRLYTIAEACELLRISRWSLYQLINRRELRSITIGSRRLITVEDFDRYIENRRQEAA